MQLKNKYYTFCFAVLMTCQSMVALSQSNTQTIEQKTYSFNPAQYNVEWQTPGVNAKSSMPVGNGDMGANVWVDEEGNIQLLLSKTDAFDEFNRLLKLGILHIQTTPSIIANDEKYLQTLQLKDGSIQIKTSNATIKIWADANHPVLQIDVVTKKAVLVKAWIENWRKKNRMLENKEAHSAYGDRPEDFRMNADSILLHGKQFIACCHRNIESVWEKNLTLTGLQNQIQQARDPLNNRCFGMMVFSKQLIASNDSLLTSNHAIATASIQIFSQTLFSTCADWIKKNIQLQNNITQISDEERFKAHQKWWQQYWNKSWIEITGANGFDSTAWKVSQIYTLQRYINACGGRGAMPIKFNGSIFTVNEMYSPDFRMWGGCFWWQNTRLPYWSMLYSGDYNLMLPLFKMYINALSLRKAATKKYYNHKGAFFPETINFWGNYNDENYGIDRTNKEDGLTVNTYIRRYWQSGLELIALMLDYYDHTQNEKFKKDTLLPLAYEITTFYNEHWKRNDSGIIIFSPAQSLETWQTAVNPTPDIAGLKYILPRLMNLSNTNLSHKKMWQLLLSSLPPVPLDKKNGITHITPAEKFTEERNIENCEMYAIFPYPLYTDLSDKSDYQIGLTTWQMRKHKEDYGWQQNCIQAALLGLSNEAQKMIIDRAYKTANGYRFPGFFGPNYDWTPDQDHPSAMLIALQRMIMQCDGDRIVLMPAWPANWNVHFKLQAPYQTIVTGYLENRTIKNLNVYPNNRKKDIEIKH